MGEPRLSNLREIQQQLGYLLDVLTMVDRFVAELPRDFEEYQNTVNVMECTAARR